MINIFHLLTLQSLEECIRAAFGTASQKDLKPILSILVGANYVRMNEGFFFLNRRKESLLQFEGVRIDDIKARTLGYYQRYQPGLYRQFRRVRNAR